MTLIQPGWALARPLFFLLVVLLVMVWGCDEFTPLDPDPPPTEPDLRLTLALAPDTLAIEEGTTDSIVATIRDAGGTDVTDQYRDALVWSTSDEALVTVEGGAVLGTGGPGWAAVTATLEYSEGEETAESAVAAYPFLLDVAFNPDRPDSLGIDTLEVTQSAKADMHVEHDFPGAEPGVWLDSVAYTVLDSAAATVESSGPGWLRFSVQESGTVRLEAAIEARGKRFADTLEVFVHEPAPLVLSADSVHLVGSDTSVVITATFRGEPFRHFTLETVTVEAEYPDLLPAVLDGASLTQETLKLIGPGRATLRARGGAEPWILPADLVVTGEITEPIVLAMDAPAEITADGTPVTLRGINLLAIDPLTVTAGHDTVAVIAHTDTTFVFATEVYSATECGGTVRRRLVVPGADVRIAGGYPQLLVPHQGDVISLERYEIRQMTAAELTHCVRIAVTEPGLPWDRQNEYYSDVTWKDSSLYNLVYVDTTHFQYADNPYSNDPVFPYEGPGWAHMAMGFQSRTPMPDLVYNVDQWYQDLIASGAVNTTSPDGLSGLRATTDDYPAVLSAEQDPLSVHERHAREEAEFYQQQAELLEGATQWGPQLGGGQSVPSGLAAAYDPGDPDHQAICDAHPEIDCVSADTIPDWQETPWFGYEGTEYMYRRAALAVGDTFTTQTTYTISLPPIKVEVQGIYGGYFVFTTPWADPDSVGTAAYDKAVAMKAEFQNRESVIREAAEYLLAEAEPWYQQMLSSSHRPRTMVHHEQLVVNITRFVDSRGGGTAQRNMIDAQIGLRPNQLISLLAHEFAHNHWLWERQRRYDAGQMPGTYKQWNVEGGATYMAFEVLRRRAAYRNLGSDGGNIWAAFNAWIGNPPSRLNGEDLDVMGFLGNDWTYGYGAAAAFFDFLAMTLVRDYGVSYEEAAREMNEAVLTGFKDGNDSYSGTPGCGIICTMRKYSAGWEPAAAFLEYAQARSWFGGNQDPDRKDPRVRYTLMSGNYYSHVNTFHQRPKGFLPFTGPLGLVPGFYGWGIHDRNLGGTFRLQEMLEDPEYSYYPFPSTERLNELVWYLTAVPPRPPNNCLWWYTPPSGYGGEDFCLRGI